MIRMVCIVDIKGYGVVHTGVAKFEARKRRKVDLISFDMVILKKLSNLNVPRNTLTTLCRRTDLLAC